MEREGRIEGGRKGEGRKVRGEERGGEGGKGRGEQRKGGTVEKREEREEEGKKGERQQEKMRVMGIQRLFHLSPYHMLYGIPHIRLFIQLVPTCQTS